MISLSFILNSYCSECESGYSGDTCNCPDTPCEHDCSPNGVCKCGVCEVSEGQLFLRNKGQCNTCFAVFLGITGVQCSMNEIIKIPWPLALPFLSCNNFLQCDPSTGFSGDDCKWSATLLRVYDWDWSDMWMHSENQVTIKSYIKSCFCFILIYCFSCVALLLLFL